jgi:hypothetical protein
MVKYATALLIGFLIPTLTFEAYRLFELGGHGYLANCQELFNWIKAQGMPGNTHVNVLLMRQRIALVHDSFGVNLIGLVALIAFGMLFYWRSTSKNWISLSAGLLLSVATTAIYWATLSIWMGSLSCHGGSDGSFSLERSYLHARAVA